MNTRLNRSRFLKSLALGAAGLCAPQAGVRAFAGPGEDQGAPRTLIDTHTHFYDPSRPKGVPWPPASDKVLHRTVLPSHYRQLPKPRPVTGTVVVEASPWIEDNQWILDLADKEPLIAGFVGNLSPGQAGFPTHLERFAAHSLFRGIRLRPAPGRARWEDKKFVADLRLLVTHDLSLDLVGGLEILELAGRLASTTPTLRIVIDHLAGVQIDGKAPPRAWIEALRALTEHAQVCFKVSGLVEGTGKRGGGAPTDTSFYRPVLDTLWDLFGEDRLIYGSNWPVCEHYASLETVQRLAQEYFATKGAAVLDKVFALNARRAYRWVRRDPSNR